MRHSNEQVTPAQFLSRYSQTGRNRDILQLAVMQGRNGSVDGFKPDIHPARWKWLYKQGVLAPLNQDPAKFPKAYKGKEMRFTDFGAEVAVLIYERNTASSDAPDWLDRFKAGRTHHHFVRGLRGLGGLFKLLPFMLLTQAARADLGLNDTVFISGDMGQELSIYGDYFIVHYGSYRQGIKLQQKNTLGSFSQGAALGCEFEALSRFPRWLITEYPELVCARDADVWRWL